MIAALISGSLIADPVRRQTRNGGTFATGTLRVSAGADSVVVGLVTVDAAACERLLKLQGVRPVGCRRAGGEHLDRQEGKERSGWRLAVTEIMSLAQARRRRAEAAEEVEA
jgi:hypothetical protein